MDTAEDRALDSEMDDFLARGIEGLEMPCTCKYCGLTELYWDATKWGSRLHNKDGSVHRCREYAQHHNLTP
jgi:hypothetical protein